MIKPFTTVCLKELRDPKKTIFMYLSNQEGELSWSTQQQDRDIKVLTCRYLMTHVNHKLVLLLTL